MANQTNLITDVGTILKIPTKVTNELAEKACLCVGNSIGAAKQAGEEILTLNIGIGLLSINLLDMQCKFIPSKQLKHTIKEAMNNKVDPLEIYLEQALADKLITICDEVI